MKNGIRAIYLPDINRIPKLNGAKTRTNHILRFGKLLGPDRDTAGTRVRSVCMCVS